VNESLRGQPLNLPAADFDRKYAEAATEAWVHSFDPPSPPKPHLGTPWLRKFREELAKTPPGTMPDLPDFLDRRADRDDEEEAA